MKIIVDNAAVEISFSRLNKLQQQFNKNYNGIAREIFNNLDEDIRLQLLEDEFMFDKQIIMLVDSLNSFHRSLKNSRFYYMYTPQYSQLGGYPNARIHVRHNAYRTISALLLDNCTFEEKALILSRSISKSKFKQSDVLDIATYRLNALISKLNTHTL